MFRNNQDIQGIEGHRTLPEQVRTDSKPLEIGSDETGKIFSSKTLHGGYHVGTKECISKVRRYIGIYVPRSDHNKEQEEKVETPIIVVNAVKINKNTTLCAQKKNSEGILLQRNTI